MLSHTFHLQQMLAIFFVATCVCSQIKSRELIQGNLIWRHGDRSSKHTYPNDPHKGVWKNGVMQLTERGTAQEYNLGLYLRSKYGHLISKNYQEGEIYIKSTRFDRTLISAQCVVAGLYASKSISTREGTDFPLKLFPIYSNEFSNDWLLEIFQNPEKKCPEYENMMIKIKQSSEWYRTFEKRYGIFLEKLQHFTGTNDPYTIDSILPLYDNLICLKSNGYKLPDWAEGEVLESLKKLVGIKQGLQFTDYEMKNTKTLAKMRSGIVLEKMVTNMRSRVNGETKFSFIGYSAHDSSLVPLLVSMGAFNWIVPPYASCVMLDLYKNDNGSYHVEFLYRNDSSKEPHRFSFYECGTGCSWEKFQEVVATVSTDSSTSKICAIQDETDHCCWLLVFILFVMMVVLFVAVRFLFKRHLQCRKLFNCKLFPSRYSKNSCAENL